MPMVKTSNGSYKFTKTNMNSRPNMDLFEACLKGNLKGVRDAFAANAHPDTKFDLDWTPLLRACQGGHIEIVKELILRKANVDLCNKHNWSPLQTAAYNGHHHIVEYLISKKATIDSKDEIGWTPLIAASFNGHLEVVKSLIHHQADVFTLTDANTSPLILAMNNGYANVVDVLLAAEDQCQFQYDNQLKRRQKMIKDRETIRAASEMENNKLSLMSARQYEHINEKLWQAADNGYLDGVRNALEAGADIHYTGSHEYDALEGARRSGNRRCGAFIRAFLLHRTIPVDSWSSRDVRKYAEGILPLHIPSAPLKAQLVNYGPITGQVIKTAYFHHLLWDVMKLSEPQRNALIRASTCLKHGFQHSQFLYEGIRYYCRRFENIKNIINLSETKYMSNLNAFYRQHVYIYSHIVAAPVQHHMPLLPVLLKGKDAEEDENGNEVGGDVGRGRSNRIADRLRWWTNLEWSMGTCDDPRCYRCKSTGGGSTFDLENHPNLKWLKNIDSCVRCIHPHNQNNSNLLIRTFSEMTKNKPYCLDSPYNMKYEANSSSSPTQVASDPSGMNTQVTSELEPVAEVGVEDSEGSSFSMIDTSHLTTSSAFPSSSPSARSPAPAFFVDPHSHESFKPSKGLTINVDSPTHGEHDHDTPSTSNSNLNPPSTHHLGLEYRRVSQSGAPILLSPSNYISPSVNSVPGIPSVKGTNSYVAQTPDMVPQLNISNYPPRDANAFAHAVQGCVFHSQSDIPSKLSALSETLHHHHPNTAPCGYHLKHGEVKRTYKLYMLCDALWSLPIEATNNRYSMQACNDSHPGIVLKLTDYQVLKLAPYLIYAMWIMKLHSELNGSRLLSLLGRYENIGTNGGGAGSGDDDIRHYEALVKRTMAETLSSADGLVVNAASPTSNSSPVNLRVTAPSSSIPGGPMSPTTMSVATGSGIVLAPSAFSGNSHSNFNSASPSLSPTSPSTTSRYIPSIMGKPEATPEVITQMKQFLSHPAITPKYNRACSIPLRSIKSPYYSHDTIHRTEHIKLPRLNPDTCPRMSMIPIVIPDTLLQQNVTEEDEIKDEIEERQNQGKSRAWLMLKQKMQEKKLTTNNPDILRDAPEPIASPSALDFVLLRDNKDDTDDFVVVDDDFATLNNDMNQTSVKPVNKNCKKSQNLENVPNLNPTNSTTEEYDPDVLTSTQSGISKAGNGNIVINISAPPSASSLSLALPSHRRHNSNPRSSSKPNSPALNKKNSEPFQAIASAPVLSSPSPSSPDPTSSSDPSVASITTAVDLLSLEQLPELPSISISPSNDACPTESNDDIVNFGETPFEGDKPILERLISSPLSPSPPLCLVTPDASLSQAEKDAIRDTHSAILKMSERGQAALQNVMAALVSKRSFVQPSNNTPSSKIPQLARIPSDKRKSSSNNTRGRSQSMCGEDLSTLSVDPDTVTEEEIADAELLCHNNSLYILEELQHKREEKSATDQVPDSKDSEDAKDTQVLWDDEISQALTCIGFYPSQYDISDNASMAKLFSCYAQHTCTKQDQNYKLYSITANKSCTRQSLHTITAESRSELFHLLEHQPATSKWKPPKLTYGLNRVKDTKEQRDLWMCSKHMKIAAYLNRTKFRPVAKDTVDPLDDVDHFAKEGKCVIM